MLCCLLVPMLSVPRTSLDTFERQLHSQMERSLDYKHRTRKYCGISRHHLSCWNIGRCGCRQGIVISIPPEI